MPGIFGRRIHKVDVPTCWNELTADQLTVIAGLVHIRQGDIYRFRISVIKCLMKLKWHHILTLKDRIVDLYPYFDWLEQENTLTIQKYEYLKVGKIKFYGPIGDFETLKADEWTDADTAFLDYHTSKEEADLDKFVAVLFRERKKGVWPGSAFWKNDWRQDYNEHTVNLRAQYLTGIDKRVKLGILTWYQGCRGDWELIFERVFKGNQQMIESFGWQETIQKMSGSTFGDMEKTMGTYMYKLMLNMEITLKDEEARKEQERMQKLKNQ